MIIKLNLDVNALESIPMLVRENLFTKIADASLEGNHLILIPGNLSKWIQSNVSMSTVQMEHIVEICRSYLLQGEFMDHSHASLNINLEGALSRSADGRFWNIGYRELMDAGYLNKPAIIVENIKYDGTFYKMIFNHIEKIFSKKYVNMLKLNYMFFHGGGESSSDLLEYLMNEKYGMIIPICDTDILVPKGVHSKTYLRIQKIYNENFGNYLLFMKNTPGRELENFLSLEIISEITKEKYSNTIAELMELRDSQIDCASGDCLWLYFDVKKGVSKTKMLKNCRQDDVDESKSWISKKYKNSNEWENDLTYCGFGKDIIKRFLELDGDRQSKLMTEHMDSSYWKLHFFDWVETIAWCLCCGNKDRENE